MKVLGEYLEVVRFAGRFQRASGHTCQRRGRTDYRVEQVQDAAPFVIAINPKVPRASLLDLCICHIKFRLAPSLEKFPVRLWLAHSQRIAPRLCTQSYIGARRCHSGMAACGFSPVNAFVNRGMNRIGSAPKIVGSCA